MEKRHRYLKLFLSTLYLSAFTFGGGYVIVPLMQRKFVDDLKWITEEEMLNMVAIAQSSPGAVAVNASILVGYRAGGVIGAALAILGTIIPPLVILTVISYFYQAFRSNAVVAGALAGMQAGVAAVICDVVWRMTALIIGKRDPIGRYVSLVMIVAVFIASYIYKVNIVLLILLCGGFGAIFHFWLKQYRERHPLKRGDLK